jgi:hypothetical protein
MVTGNLPRPETRWAKEISRNRSLPRCRGLPRAARATFADAGVVADAGEKSETGAGAASVPSAAKFEANLPVRYVLKYETTSAVKPAVNRALKYRAVK